MVNGSPRFVVIHSALSQRAVAASRRGPQAVGVVPSFEEAAALRAETATVVVFADGRTDAGALAKLRRACPTAVIVAVGPSAMAAAELEPMACLVLDPADDETLAGAMEVAPRPDAEKLATELIQLSVVGRDLEPTMRLVAESVTRAFEVDDCVVQVTGCVPQLARPHTDYARFEILRVCAEARRVDATVLAPGAKHLPYRAFLAAPLGHASGPPFGSVTLCSKTPRRFHEAALFHLRRLAERLTTDLSWRRVHERLREDRERLRELSSVDPMLGVSNRTALEQQLPNLVAASQRRGEPLSVAIVDLDGLAKINERFGFAAGDAALLHVADVSRKSLRGQDLVARYAGDSLAVMMPGVALTDATAIMTRILREVDRVPVPWSRGPLPLTVSCGVAALTDENDTPQAALGRAMAARARARLHGEVISVADPMIATTATQPEFEIGATLGGVYQIRHEISRGAFGVVYRAEDLALGRPVALKLLRPDLARDRDLVERFRSEAAMLARIHHQNLVEVYAFGVDGTDVYFAMELVEGMRLDERMVDARRRRAHLPFSEVTSIITEIASALEAVHRAGLIHRDVKPDNILLDRIHERSVLVDVGTAVRQGDKDPVGTPGFTAPEVFSGNREEGPWTDVYGLAAVAYMMLTLRPPFRGLPPADVVEMQGHSRPRSPLELRRDLPSAASDIVLQGMDPDPDQRPRTAREFARALLGALGQPVPAALERTTAKISSALAAAANRTSEGFSGSVRTSKPPIQQPSTRGVLFRSAYPVLGARRGGAWLADVRRDNPALATALGPRSSPLAWHPTSDFIDLLQSLGKGATSPEALAEDLGRLAVENSFGVFYSADPTAVSPEQVLRAADVYWQSYHSWGVVNVRVREQGGEVELARGVADRLLCATTKGLLGAVVTLSGGVDVRVEHPACTSAGSRSCLFRLSWRLEAVTGPNADSPRSSEG